MKMLWLSLLTLVTPVTALPLRTQDLPTRWSHAGPSEADREFAEVFTHIHEKQPTRFTGVCAGRVWLYLFLTDL